MRHETRTFYRIEIHQNATDYVNNDPQQGEDPETTHCFNIEHRDCETLDEVREYLKLAYGKAVPTFAYVDDAITGKMRPVCLVYETEGSDASHSPIQYWSQMDDVDVCKMTAETVAPSMLGIEVDA
jgi:hypothetical protein